MLKKIEFAFLNLDFEVELLFSELAHPLVSDD